jgi:hypothetical protein
MKRTMSASSRRKIAAFQRARWAKWEGGEKAAYLMQDADLTVRGAWSEVFGNEEALGY